MSLYFIRHGQTCYNSKGVFNGETNERLNRAGRKQARKAGKFFLDKNIDIVYCSPLKRTRQTLKLLKLDKKIPVVYDARLVERRVGKLAGVQIDKDNLPNLYLNRYCKEKIEGLETFDDVMKRVHETIEDIKRCERKNVLVVGHGFVGRMIYFYFNKMPEDGMLGACPESFCQNCEIREYDFN